MENQALTLTVIADITANYGEGLGNIASVQKVFRNGRVFAARSKESMRNAVMQQSGMYDDLEVTVDNVTQKNVTQEKNAATCRALEGGYMNTSGATRIRKSSFYFTDAVACEPFVNDSSFHNNLYMAQTYAKANDLNLQEKSGECGLMPYQYEYDKGIKKYSLTIDLDRVGVDENFAGAKAEPQERAARVKAILAAVQHLALVVKGNLDNAEPLFIVGGIGRIKTHYFDNIVNVKSARLQITEGLKERIDGKSYSCALLQGGNFSNEAEIVAELAPQRMGEFFDDLCKAVDKYYGVEA